MELTEKTLSSRTEFEGKIVKLTVDTVELPDGATALREVVGHPGGVCVLALLDDGTVPVVRQFRYPLGRTMLELPAGKLEYGEEPRSAAERSWGRKWALSPGR